MDNPILISIIWYPLLILFIWGLHKQTRCFTHWNMFTILGTLLVLFHGIYVPWSLDINYVVDSAAISSATKFTFMTNIMASFFMILVGIFLANKLNGFSSREIKEIDPPPSVPFGSANWKMIIVVMVMVIIGLYVDSKALGGISFWDLIKGNVDTEQYKMGRFLFNQSTSGEQGIIFYFARIMFVSWMLLFIVITYFMWKGKKRYGLALFITLSVIYLQHGLMSGHKAPIAYYFLAIFAARALSRKQRNFKKLIPLGVALFVLMFFVLMPAMYMLQYSFITYGEGIESALFRICIEPNRCLMLYYDTYPERYPFTGFSSIPLIAKAMGLTVAIPAHTYIPMFEHGQIGQSWNTAFFGDAWVGFGWAGTIFFSIFVGYLLQRINIWFERSPKTLLKSGLFISLIIAASKLSATSLPSALMTFGLGTYFLLYLLVKSWKKGAVKQKKISVIKGGNTLDTGNLSPTPIKE